MKSSKVENILDYNPPLEDSKTLSPFTYYQPFQSSFDPEFSISPPKPILWPNTQINRWSQDPERAPGGPYLSGGTLTPWELHKGSLAAQSSLNSLNSRPASLPELKDSFSGASTSAWGEPEGRSLCNSTWQNPVSPKVSFSGYEESQSSKCRMSNVEGLAMCSPFPPNGNAGLGGMAGGRMEGASASFRTKGDFGHSTRHVNFDGSSTHSPYYPFMLGSSGKNIGQNLFKTGYSRPMMCNFCKNNKEVPDIYLNHYLYDPETKILSCPVLRKHVCEICGGTGDQAHTLQYCPVNRERGLQSKVPVLLKTRTITNSTGKIRRN